MNKGSGNAKNDFRKLVRDRILAMSEQQRKDKSSKAVSKLKSLEEFSRAKCVMVYVSKEDEVDTIGLITDMLKSGKRVVVPLVDEKSRKLIPCEISSIEELAVGTFGLLEPDPEKARIVSMDEVDLMVVPGRAFDRNCNRLGRGKGYFDMFLKRFGEGKKVIGLAFSEQVFDSIPVNENDVKVNIVVTESSIIRCGSGEPRAGLNKKTFDVHKLATSSLFMALFIVLRAVPTFPIIGVPGGSFPVSDVILPLYGVLLEPVHSATVILLGTILGYMIRPPRFLYLDFLPPLVNTLTVSLLWRRKTWLAFFIYVSVLAVFMTGPFSLLLVHLDFPGLEVDLPFHWLHLIAMPASLILIRLGSFKHKPDQIVFKFSGCALLGTMGQHSMGSALFGYVFGLTGMINREGFEKIWYTVFWIYPIERMLLVLVSTLIGVPAIRVLTRIIWRPQNPS
ncbi:MAG: 5-formyltetrahydrofolate cyclo-ligase [Thermoproteota archaeon]